MDLWDVTAQNAPDFNKKFYEEIFDRVEKSKKDNINETLVEMLKRIFGGSSMNICQTQQLPMMKVPEMMVELKDEYKICKPGRLQE